MKCRSIVRMLLSTLFVSSLHAQSYPAGTVEGIVLDAATQTPLIGANVLIVNTKLGAVCSENGRFTITGIPVGSYSVRFSMVGYAPLIKTDVIVRPQRSTEVNAELPESAVASDQVEVTAGYFHPEDVQSMNTVGLSREEIRRAPGSGGDVSRIIMGLPSIAKVNDQSNSLVVRGGSPLENAFYIDGIEIPNINHFPTQGATGGPIGMVNVDLIDDVTFHTGGFSPLYGDKLSSVLDIRFREGDREKFDSQLDLNIAGFGGVAEGPVGEKGSYLTSARRSYLEYVVKLFDVGTSAVPSYGDLQGKITYDITPGHTLSLIGIYGDDHNNPGLKSAVENDMLYYGNQDIYQGSCGIAWRALWDNSGYSMTSLGYLVSSYDEDSYETNTAGLIRTNSSSESAVVFRNDNHFRLNEYQTIEFGVDAKQLMNTYSNMYAAYSDPLGSITPASFIAQHLSAALAGVFANDIVKLAKRFTVSAGARTDYFSVNNRVTVAPRGSMAYQLDDVTTVRMSAGIYYQHLPLLLISQDNANTSLRDPSAVHYIAGFDRLLADDTKLTVEAYEKNYYDEPVDPAQPSLFPLDEVFYGAGFYLDHGRLTNDGRARSRGIEVTVQKKMAKEIYGLLSAAYFRSEYRSIDGVWRTRAFDNRFIFSVEGGYKPNNEWEFSARWIYAGGAPYTPLDLVRSSELHRSVFETGGINSARYPAYHSLNVRFDKRFHFQTSGLVVYLSAWNAYNRKNVAGYFWNEEKNKEETLYQWALLPIFGVEYEL